MNDPATDKISTRFDIDICLWPQCMPSPTSVCALSIFFPFSSICIICESKSHCRTTMYLQNAKPFKFQIIMHTIQCTQYEWHWMDDLLHRWLLDSFLFSRCPLIRQFIFFFLFHSVLGNVFFSYGFHINWSINGYKSAREHLKASETVQ